MLTRRLLDEQKEQHIEEALKRVRLLILKLKFTPIFSLIFQADALAKRREELRCIEEEKDLEERERQRILYNEAKYRQQVRENNQELRELETKLRTAYVSKALAAQKAEKEALQLQEKLEAKKEYEEMDKERLRDLDELQKERELRRQQKVQLRKDLEHQIISAHQQNQVLYDEFLREKYYLDEIAKRVQDELIQEIQQKIEMREQTKKEMEEFKEIKKVWQKQQEIELNEENQRIQEYCRERDQKIQQEENRRKELAKSKMDLNEKMVAELWDLEKKKLEREDLLQDLYAFEMSEKEDIKIQEEMERQFRKRIETRLALERQLMDQWRIKQQQIQTDKEFQEEQMKLMAERDRIDQMSNEKRRRRILEHRRETFEMLEERKTRRAQNMAESIKAHESAEKLEQRKQEIIEEERIKMLKEHAEALIGFLPPGILRKTDSEYLPIQPKK